MALVSFWRTARQRSLYAESAELAAETLGISLAELLNLESGTSFPSAPLLRKACQLYECQPGDLYKLIHGEIVQAF